MTDEQVQRRADVGALTQYFVEDLSLGDTLTRIASLACEVSGADMAGLTMLVDGKVATGVFTDPEAPRIDEAQYDDGVGPCIDAFRHGRVYRIVSTEDEVRWPEFAAAAAAAGICCTLSLPVIARDEPLAALNLYARTPGTLTETSAEDLDGLLQQAAIVMANAQAYWGARALSENLAEALTSRSTIDQAIGLLLAPGGRTPEEAYQMLVRASQRENRKLRDIAAELVQRSVLRLPPSP